MMDRTKIWLIAAFVIVALATTAYLVNGSRYNEALPVSTSGTNSDGEKGASIHKKADISTQDNSDERGASEPSPREATPNKEGGQSVRRATSSLERGLIPVVNHLFGEELQVPSDIEMTDEEWEECRKLYMSSTQEVGKWGKELGKQWDLYLPQMTQQGRFDEELVPDNGGLRPPVITVKGQRTLSQWTQNEEGQRVRRVYRINPGTYEAFDNLAKSYDSAEQYQKDILMRFFARVLHHK